MEDRGLLSLRTWSTVRIALGGGALVGALITVATYLGARITLQGGYKPLGFDLVTLAGIVCWPAYWLANTLRIPVDFWKFTFLPGATGLIYATVLNGFLLSAVGAVAAWLWLKLRKLTTSAP